MMILYQDSLNGLGRFPSEPYNIEVSVSYQPKKISTIHLSIPEQADFKQQLTEIQAVDMIKPVNHATYWMSSFVIIERKDN